MDDLTGEQKKFQNTCFTGTLYEVREFFDYLSTLGFVQAPTTKIQAGFYYYINYHTHIGYAEKKITHKPYSDYREIFLCDYETPLLHRMFEDEIQEDINAFELEIIKKYGYPDKISRKEGDPS